MNALIILDEYKKMLPEQRVVFLDVIDELSKQIRLLNYTMPNTKGALVQWTKIAIFAYKKNVGFWEVISKYYNTQNEYELSILSVIRKESIWLLEKWLVAQKIPFLEGAKDKVDELFGKPSKQDVLFIYNEASQSLSFNHQALTIKDWEVILEDWAKRWLSDLTEEERKHVDTYNTLVTAFWGKKLDDLANLDASYFEFDFILTDRWDLEDLKDILLRDLEKSTIRSFDFSNWDLIINDKTLPYILTRKNDWKSIEFIQLISAYFSCHHNMSVSLRQLIEFVEWGWYKLHKILLKDLATPKNLKSYITTFNKFLQKNFWAKPEILRMKWSTVELIKQVWSI